MNTDITKMCLSELKNQLFNVEKFDFIAIFANCPVDENTELQPEEMYNFIAWCEPDTFQDVLEIVFNDEDSAEELGKIPENATVTVLTNPNTRSE